MGKAVKKAKKKATKKAAKKAPAKEQPFKLDITFEEAMRRSIQTRAPKKKG
jgi:hypothetical protein